MAEKSNKRRSPSTATRNRQRDATRTAILEAASAAFVERGYAGTTIAMVAKTADVSAESVYVIFGNKRSLLRAAVERASTGDDSGEGLLRDEWLDRVRAEPDQQRRYEIITEATRDSLERVAPLDAVVRAAALADPDIAALQREHDDRRRHDIGLLVALLEECGPLRLPAAEAADVMWALSRSTDFYITLTRDRGWAPHRAFDALNDAIARVLFLP